MSFDIYFLCSLFFFPGEFIVKFGVRLFVKFSVNFGMLCSLLVCKNCLERFSCKFVVMFVSDFCFL